MKIPRKINLAHLPTPLEKINFGSKKFLMKRDDFTGSDYSGNKIRKLEYLFYEARKQKSEIIFTAGGEQSNHARATASAAAKLGFKTKLFLWGNKTRNLDGNHFLDKMYGAEIVYLSKSEFDDVDEIMTDERKKLATKGRSVYVIPSGGSSTLGIWGYISFFNELRKQVDLKKIDGIFSACGSGGTAAGLLAGAALAKSKIIIYAVNVLHPRNVIKKKILQLAEGAMLDYELPVNIDENKLKIVDGFSREGYKNISPNKINLIRNFSKSTGILLDPAYSGKAFYAYKKLVLDSRKKENIVFLHTGGIYGVFPKRSDYLKTN